MLVALAVLSVLVLVLADVTALVSKTHLQATVPVDQFRAAQDAFAALTRRLSRATLNTYFDYEDAQNNTDQAYISSALPNSFVPNHYARLSDLRFIDANLAVGGSRLCTRPFAYFRRTLALRKQKGAIVKRAADG